MIINLRARHFKDTSYRGGLCAIDKAALEIFPDSVISEAGDFLDVDGTLHGHEQYTQYKFKGDMKKARQANFDDTIIRGIEILSL